MTWLVSCGPEPALTVHFVRDYSPEVQTLQLTPTELTTSTSQITPAAPGLWDSVQTYVNRLPGSEYEYWGVYPHNNPYPTDFYYQVITPDQDTLTYHNGLPASLREIIKLLNPLVPNEAMYTWEADRGMYFTPPTPNSLEDLLALPLIYGEVTAKLKSIGTLAMGHSLYLMQVHPAQGDYIPATFLGIDVHAGHYSFYEEIRSLHPNTLEPIDRLSAKGEYQEYMEKVRWYTERKNNSWVHTTLVEYDCEVLNPGELVSFRTQEHFQLDATGHFERVRVDTLDQEYCH